MDEPKRFDDNETATAPATPEKKTLSLPPLPRANDPDTVMTGRREPLSRRILISCRDWISRHKIQSAIFAIAIVLEIVFGGGVGVRGALNIGTRNVHIENPRYAPTPDGKELVITYDVVSERTIMNPRSLGRQQAETRIPLDPLPRDVRKIVVDVVLDPAARPSIMDTLGAQSYTPEQTPAQLPCMGRLLPESGDIEPGSAIWTPDSPDVNCRLVIHPNDEPLLADNFICMTPRCLLIPSDKEGDRRAMLCLSYLGNSYPYDFAPFMREILSEHPEAMKRSRDNGFLTWCVRILLVPLGLLYDVTILPLVYLYMLLVTYMMSRGV